MAFCKSRWHALTILVILESFDSGEYNDSDVSVDSGESGNSYKSGETNTNGESGDSGEI